MAIACLSGDKLKIIEWITHRHDVGFVGWLPTKGDRRIDHCVVDHKMRMGGDGWITKFPKTFGKLVERNFRKSHKFLENKKKSKFYLKNDHQAANKQNDHFHQSFWVAHQPPKGAANFFAHFTKTLHCFLTLSTNTEP
jgi:hypothetical protein